VVEVFSSFFLRKTFEGPAIFRYHCLRQTGRNKVIRIAGVSTEELRKRIGL
jgi:hypothetical protein